MTKKELFRLLKVESLLKRPVQDALTKSELLNELNEQLHRESLPTIKDRTLDTLFRQVEEILGCEVRSERIYSSGNDRPRYIRYIETRKSITDEVITEEQEVTIREIIQQLDRMSGNPMLDELRVVLGQQIEQRTTQGSDKLIVHFDDEDTYHGRKHIAAFYDAIQNEYAISFDYQPFGKEASTVTLSPYLLKQYNRRWFCIGHVNESPYKLTHFALDRVMSSPVKEEEFKHSSFTRADWNQYFQDIIGVTYPANAEPKDIVLHFYGKARSYVYTKPLSVAQRQIKAEQLNNEPMEVTLEEIIPNFELKQKILAFGDEVEVVSPNELREEMKQMTSRMANRYKPQV